MSEALGTQNQIRLVLLQNSWEMEQVNQGLKSMRQEYDQI